MRNVYFIFASKLIRSLAFAGRILNVETQEMKFSHWNNGVDPDQSCWIERGKAHVFFLIVLRVFYEMSNEICQQQIGQSGAIRLVHICIICYIESSSCSRWF